ncbi:unnamed protein product [Owenia fusiformis]|uniref:Uncharacterized protein n=1 Tax=Owenia fusiformis TaxID=6347 RepID=A0A8J1XP54_OWEFU|nr:unnamed protein product [Owenia fusiformis]
MTDGEGIGTGRPTGLTHWADILTIIVYFVSVMAVAIWSLCRPTRKSVRGYFLAGRDMTWWPIGMSLFASNIGSEHLLGLAGTGSVSGLAVIMFEWNAIILLLFLGWLFLPVYIVSGMYTIPEYLSKRFGGQRLRIYLSCVSLITMLFTNLSVDLYSGALFIQQAIGWDLYVGVAVLISIATFYTVLGGLSTVILTDAIQVVIMLIGALTLSVIGLIKVGGLEGLRHQYSQAIPNVTRLNPVTNATCGLPREDAWHIFRDPFNADYPSIGTMIRTIIGGLWYWCANQLIVQRTLAAKSLTHAKGGTILAGYLKFLPIAIMVFPGMISRTLYPDEVACADPDVCERVCGNRVGCSNIAYPRLVVGLLPPGLRGLLLACMCSAVVSSLTSLFNSATTIFTMDLWRKIRPKSSEVELLITGRLFVVVMVVLSILLIPLMASAEGGQVFKYATTITGYLGSPTCAMFILAMFWPRCNEKGAFWGMIVSQLVGLVRFILDFIYRSPACWERDERPDFVSKIHPYYYNLIQIVVAFLLGIVISLLTEPIPREKLSGLTFWTKNDRPKKGNMNVGVTTDDSSQSDEETASEESTETEDIKCQLKNGEITEYTIAYGSTDNTDDDDRKDMQVKVIENGTRGSISSKDWEKPSLWKHWLSEVCGIGGSDNVKRPSATEEYELRMKIIQETSFWKMFMNINAIIIMVVLIFLYGFFH